MKKKLVFVAVAALLAGCQSTSGNNITEMPCYYPDAPEHDAPKWVCDVMPDGLAIGSVGYAKKSSAGLSVMRTKAVNDARKGLAQQFEVQVNTMFKEAVASKVVSTGDNVTDEVTEQFESVTKNISTRTLSNSRVIVSASSPAGGLYTLVGMDQATFDSNVAKVVETASDKESGLWKQFNNKKAEESLAQALDSMVQ